MICQEKNKEKIKNLKKIVQEEGKHEMNADEFLKIVRKYSNFEELNPEILREFTDKIYRSSLFPAKTQTIFSFTAGGSAFEWL